MSEFLYGTYGFLADSVVQATDSAPTVAAYVGTAPVNLVRNYANAGIINAPVKVSSLGDARNKIGVVSDWAKYTLSEVVAAHFDNEIGNVGPIYVINVLNPTIHRKSEETSLSLNFVNGRASFPSKDIILDTFALANKAEGTDYAISYDFVNEKVNVISANENSPLTGTIAASFYEVDASGITIEDIIGAKTDKGEYTGLRVVDLIYQNYNVIPNLLAAPGWSQEPKVYKAMVVEATKINGHWDAFVYADIPLAYTEPTEYEEVSNPNPGDDPSTKPWYEHDAEAHTYSVSEDTQVNTSKTYINLTAEAVSPQESDVPSTEGWYELDGTTYTLSTDSAIVGSKTYYSLTTSTVSDADPGDSPVTEGWFEKNGEEYTASLDAQVNISKTYYTASASTETVVDTIEKAKTFKITKGYTSERSKVFWPKSQGIDGKVYHISTLAMVETLRCDLSHDGVPFETCGNKEVAIAKQYFGAGSTNAGLDVTDMNQLCEAGIATVVFWGGSWRLWGDSTAAYTFEGDMDMRAVFDVSMRMLLYLTNRFQRVWAPVIDDPFTLSVKDRILTREQEHLDSLVALGALIGKPQIIFEQDANPIGEIRQGNFRFDIQATPTPPLHSASAYVAYTDAGFSAYFE